MSVMASFIHNIGFGCPYFYMVPIADYVSSVMNRTEHIQPAWTKCTQHCSLSIQGNRPDWKMTNAIDVYNRRNSLIKKEAYIPIYMNLIYRTPSIQLYNTYNKSFPQICISHLSSKPYLEIPSIIVRLFSLIAISIHLQHHF